jgi:ATP-dependent RNA helicase DHX29
MPNVAFAFEIFSYFVLDSVVVDEVHERQCQVDILLVSLRKLLHGSRPDLKVILMSASLDASLFSSYFMDAPVIRVGGKFFPVSTLYLEDLLEKTGHIIEEGSRCAQRKLRDQETVSMLVTARRGDKQLITTDYDILADLADEYLDFTVSTRNSMKRVDETVINYDLIEDVLMTLFQEDSTAFATVYRGKIDGAVLIFLPGIGEIRNLLDRLSGSRFFGDSRRFRIVALHSTLSSSDQRFAFCLPPKGCQKIILSTNIAETR